MRIIYACPFYNSTGHQRSATFNESRALEDAGHQVLCVTGKRTFTGTFRWFTMLFETWVALNKAVRKYKSFNADFIFVRDGDPFLFISHILSLRYCNMNWLLSLTAGIVFKPKVQRRLNKDLFVVALDNLLTSLINCPLWYPLYKLAQINCTFRYLPQNPYSVKVYEEYMLGVFKGKVELLRLGIPKVEIVNTKSDKPTLLHFGSNHVGKDIDLVFNAMRSIHYVKLIYAGSSTVSLDSDPSWLSLKYNVWKNVEIYNAYITENEKKHYFGVCDAVVLSYTKEFFSTTSMLLEACAYGKPVVASNSGELGDLVRGNGLGMTFEPGDVESYVGAVSYVLLHGQEAFRKNCLDFAERHSMNNWAARVLDIYVYTLKFEPVATEVLD